MKRPLFLTGISLGLLLLYLLTPPFALALSSKLNFGPTASKALGLFYQPAGWLGSHCPAYQRWMMQTLHSLDSRSGGECQLGR